MHLAKVTIEDFRRLSTLEIDFGPGLNIIVGPNNAGKTTVVDGLRALIAGPDGYPLRLREEDIRSGVPARSAVTLRYVFRDLTPDDEADFLHGFVPLPDGGSEVHITARYSDPDRYGRLRLKRWCGDDEERLLTSDMQENLRGVYLPPLRDASQALRPSWGSELARLMRLLATEEGRSEVTKTLEELDRELMQHQPLGKTQTVIQSRHNSMIGELLSQALTVALSPADFDRMSARVSLLIDEMEIAQNGLGFNNLIYMAVVLSELSMNPDSAYRGLIVEEPEAHLHPQLQAVLLRYLERIHDPDGDGHPVQVFVTSHSPDFASIARLDSLVCLFESVDGVEAFLPGRVEVEEVTRRKLERYLDVTRAELFFARRAILVEGAAELFLMDVLAQRAGFDLRQSAVSVISVDGLNFDCFAPLFGENAMKIPVAIITDADPTSEEDDESGEYPEPGDNVVVSNNTAKLLERQDEFLRVFHGVKTFEYDLALYSSNRDVMIEVLKTLHPRTGERVEADVAAAASEGGKAKALFRGMFERTSNNVQKGRFSQALAQHLTDDRVPFDVPEYLREALKHACESQT